MANFDNYGAPTKYTPASIGDICTDTRTGKSYILSAIYSTYINNKKVYEYEWEDIRTINGEDGEAGFSPTVNVTEIDKGHRVSITDVNGTKSFDVMDGSGADVIVDTEMSDSSTNAVQNSTIKKYVDEKEVIVSASSDNALEQRDDGLYVSPVERSLLDYVNESQGIEDAPVGHIISYMGKTAPAHYLVCDGTKYNIADYPYLSQHILEQFGTVNFFGGDGTTTFAVPDLRGEFLRGSGTATRNSGTGAAVGVHQYPTEMPVMYIAKGSSGLFIGGRFDEEDTTDNFTGIMYGDKTIQTVNGNKATFGEVKLSTTGESAYTSDKITVRPTNTAVLYCIKYEPTYFMQNTYNGNEEVVLWEGSHTIDCSTEGSLNLTDQIITLTDRYENYDTLKFIYRARNSSDGTGDRVKVCEWFTSTKGKGSISLNIVDIMTFVVFAYVASDNTVNFFMRHVSNKAKTIFDQIEIMQVLGYKTTLVKEEV